MALPAQNSLPWFRVMLLGAALSTTLASAHAQSTAAPPYVFTHLAGPLGGYGNANGTGAAARFVDPCALAMDRDGNNYVVDRGNGRIRKVSVSGTVTDVAGSDLRLLPDVSAGDPYRDRYYQGGIAVATDGTVYFSVPFADRIYKLTPTGEMSVFAGGKPALRASPDSSPDGTGTAAYFNRPHGLALDAAGNLYVADLAHHLIRKITPAGAVTTLAGAARDPGSADGDAATARFRWPSAVTVDGAGNVYVADEGNHVIRKITPAGVVSTLAGTAGETGHADGLGSAARFNSPHGLVADPAGNIYVADTANFIIRRITPAGSVTTVAGSGGAGGNIDGAGAAARFHGPNGLTLDGTGNLYVADGSPTNNFEVNLHDAAGTIRKITPTGAVSTLAGLAGARGSTDGTGTAARFDRPGSAAVDAAGNLYVADENNSVIRKITPAGVVSTLAGTAGSPGSADGAGAAARFWAPVATAVDAQGNVYVADNANCTVRKITPAGAVTTLAGTAGQLGWADGTGADARFSDLLGIAVDANGDIYVTDTNFLNVSGYQNGMVRKITSAGKVTTLAGNPNGAVINGDAPSRDGTGSAASFSYPAGIALDAQGTIFVADPYAGDIRKVTPAGVVTTLTGLVDETGAAVQLQNPTGITVDAIGNLFVTDTLTHQVHRITPDGVLSTLAGMAEVSGSADGLGAAVQFNYPAGISVDAAGNLYVADTRNNAIRKGQRADAPIITTQPQSQSVDSGTVIQFSVTAYGQPAPTYQWYFNGNPFSGATGSTLNITNVRTTDAGEYTVVVSNSLGSVTSSKAVLTVKAIVSPPPVTGGGGGGGGSPSLWFCGALALLGLARRLIPRSNFEQEAAEITEIKKCQF